MANQLEAASCGKDFLQDVALSLFLRMKKYGSTTRMVYDIKEVDDTGVVLLDDGEKEIHFIQAMHADVNVDEFKYLDLCKHLKSYLRVIYRFEQEAFKRRCGLSRESGEQAYRNYFHLFTNQDLRLTDNEWVSIEDRQVPEILRFPGSKARNLKLKPTEKAIQEISDYMNKDIFENALKEYFVSEKVSQILNKTGTKNSAAHSMDLENEAMAELPPSCITEAAIVAFFRELTLSVRQPNDFQAIMASELRTWMKTWIRPDMLGQMSKQHLDHVLIGLKTYFEEASKQLLLRSNVESCLEEIQCGMKKVMTDRVCEEVEELEKYYINRRIKYEEASKEPNNGHDDSNIKTSERAKVHQISDTKFVEELRGKFKDHQHILLVADSGMGKTSLIQFIAFEYQKQNDTYVFLVYFSALVEELDKREKVADLDEAVGILSAVLSKENCDIIRNGPEERDAEGYSIVLVLDAIDEINSKYRKKALAMLKQLSFKKSIQMIVSSGNHNQELLENELNVNSMFLEPFSEDEQINYLKMKWLKDSVEDDEELRAFEILLSKIQYSLGEVSGSPLMMRMLTEIYSEKFIQFVSPKDIDIMEQFNFPRENLNIVHVYDQFVRKCFHKKIVKKFEPNVEVFDSELNPIIDGYILEHQLLAIKLLDIDILENLLKNPYYRMKYDQFINRCIAASDKSVLVKVVNNKVQFCHKSYSEYFVANYLCHHIFTLEADTVISVLSKYEVVRKFAMINLAEDKANFEILNDLCKIKWDIALWACESGVLEMVSSLKENFQFFPITNLNMMLKVSSKNGFSDICDFLMSCNRNLDTYIALQSAVENGHVKVAKLLISYKIDVNGPTSNVKTPLHIAAQNGHTDIVAFLMDNTFDPNEVHGNQCTALHLAAQNGHTSIVDLLLRFEADATAKDKNQWTALHMASANGHSNVVDQLLRSKSDLNAQGTDQWTALHWAAQNGHDGVANLLMKSGANTSSRTIDGRTPLHITARCGHTDVVALLMENASNLDEKDDDQCTALHRAAQNGHHAVVDLLVRKQADFNAQERNQWTALHMAAANGHTNIVELLIRNHADVNVQGTDQWTALHWAAQNGRDQVVRLLIEEGANTDARTLNGETPLQLAELSGHANIAAILMKNDFEG